MAEALNRGFALLVWISGQMTPQALASLVVGSQQNE